MSAAALASDAARGLGRLWDYVRAVMGDKAYESYVEVTKRRGATPLSAADFYVESVKRRYSTVSRCC